MVFPLQQTPYLAPPLGRRHRVSHSTADSRVFFGRPRTTKCHSGMR